MTHIGVGLAKWSTVCAVLLSAVALLPTTAALADSTDDAFVAALAREGIAFPDNNTAIAIAHTCAPQSTRPTNQAFWR